jgi:hypothetical protein
MSLVRLLATGRSLVGLHDSESRYRVNSKRLLPKFNDENPFGGSVPRTIAGTGVAAPPAHGAAAAVPAAPKVSGAVELGFFRRSVARLAKWLARKPPVVRSAIPRFDKGPVQGELSLERVRVVRNDLSDSDLAIVPVKTPADKARPTKNENMQAAEPAKETARLL